MILNFDHNLEQLVGTLKPKWIEFRARSSQFEKHGESGFRSLSFMLIGDPSLLCYVGSEMMTQPRIEYFPIQLQEIEWNKPYPFEQISLTRKGGTSEFDKKLQWLFEAPALRLLASEEECADGAGPEANRYVSRFYGGIELIDPKGRGSLRLTASDMPDFILTAEFNFGPGEP